MKELFKETISDQYNAENQLIKALPRMSKSATSSQLRSAFNEHLEQTIVHAKRLEDVCKGLGIDPSGKVCKAMVGLVEEADELGREGKSSPVLDAGLIACAQKVEHYEIAGYGTLVAYAEMLGYGNAVDVLRQTLSEEHNADSRLNQIAMNEVNKEAIGLRSNHAEVI